MSIKPRFASMIFSGLKTVELRRVCPKVGDGDLVIVYVSGPRMALLGAFLVGGIVKAKPSVLARNYAIRAGLQKDEILKYFAGKEEGYGIQIKATWEFAEAKELTHLRSMQVGFHPPQSYRYVDQRELAKLIS